MIEGERSLSGLRLRDWNSRRVDPLSQRLGRAGVDDAATRHDERALRRADELGRADDRGRFGEATLDVPGPLGQKLVRDVERLSLYVLWKRERDRAGVSGTHENAHRRERRWHDLLGTHDAVEVARDGTEHVVHRDVAGPRHLQLLQHWVGRARREHIAGQEEHGDAVDRRESGAGEACTIPCSLRAW